MSGFGSATRVSLGLALYGGTQPSLPGRAFGAHRVLDDTVECGHARTRWSRPRTSTVFRHSGAWNVCPRCGLDRNQQRHERGADRSWLSGDSVRVVWQELSLGEVARGPPTCGASRPAGRERPRCPAMDCGAQPRRKRRVARCGGDTPIARWAASGDDGVPGDTLHPCPRARFLQLAPLCRDPLRPVPGLRCRAENRGRFAFAPRLGARSRSVSRSSQRWPSAPWVLSCIL